MESGRKSSKCPLKKLFRGRVFWTVKLRLDGRNANLVDIRRPCGIRKVRQNVYVYAFSRSWRVRYWESPMSSKPWRIRLKKIQRRSKSTRHYLTWSPMLLRYYFMGVSLVMSNHEIYYISYSQDQNAFYMISVWLVVQQGTHSFIFTNC